MRSATKKFGLAGVVAAGMLLSAGASFAQLDPGAPIDITADSSETIQSQCVTTWAGSVEALQGRTRLRANTVSLHTARKSDGCGSTERMTAKGDVYFVTPERTVRADDALYTFGNETIVLTGNVIVVQGKSVVRGDRMVINTKTGQANMTSKAQGRNKSGRVRGVFYPNEGTSR